MTTPHYQQGCVAGSQEHGDAGVPRAFWQVNGNNGNVNNDNRDNKAFSRPCRFVARPGECQGEVSLEALYKAWQAARRNKQPSGNQLKFESHWMDNLLELQEQLQSGTWQPRPSTCFVATRPKARQIHAPDFADRVVHHLVVPTMVDVFEPKFIHDSYANRVRKGSHAAVRRLKKFVREVHSGQGKGWYLQLDIHNFFYSIDRRRLWPMLRKRLAKADVSPVVMQVAHALLRHHVEHYGVHHRATAAERALVPLHKRLENSATGHGLPIGNLPSQFFSNVYMDPFDQFVKHELKARRYIRYVDDFVLVHEDRSVLATWKDRIEAFLTEVLGLSLKDDVRLRPLTAGIDFLGYVVYPTHTKVRQRVLKHASEALQAWQTEHVINDIAVATPSEYRQLASIWASYQGHMRHANAHRLQSRMLMRSPWLDTLTSTKRRFSHRLEGRPVTIKVRK